MINNIEKFQNIALDIEKQLKTKNEIREKLLKLSRELIRYSGQAIANIHSKRFHNTHNQLNTASDTYNEMLKLVNYDPSFTDAGYVTAAFQEYAEAQILLALIEQNKLLSPEEIPVNEQSYILAIADVVGELRRHILENLVSDNIENAKGFYETMKELYGVFLQIDVGKNLIHDFRRKKDTARVLVEKTLSDLFVAVQGKKLEDKLKRIE